MQAKSSTADEDMEMREITQRVGNRRSESRLARLQAGMRRNAYLIGGILAGIAGLLAFLTLHARWIMPIWFILPAGLLISGVGGLAVGWSYSEIGHRLPERPWRTLAVIALIMMILLPSLLLGELRQPMFQVSAAGVANLAMGIPEAVIRFIGELLLTASLTGGSLGWWLGRTRRATLATALAGFTFALGPGHNIPFIGGTPGVGKEITIMAAVVVVSSVVLVETSAPLAARPRDGQTDISL